MPPIATAGSYETVEALKLASSISATDRDALILEHLLAASRAVEQLLRRRFVPVLGTNFYDWPPPYPPPPTLPGAYATGPFGWLDPIQPRLIAPGRIVLEDDLLSASSVTAQTTGQSAVPVPLTHYFLEPVRRGPPYSWLALDLSYNEQFTAGPTPQRAIAVTGAWGYGSDTVPAGTLAAVLQQTDSSLLCSDPTVIGQGDVLLCGVEALVVTARQSATPAQLTVRRGQHGTTAAAHALGDALARYRAPADVRRLVRAEAISSLQQDQASWARTVGAGDTANELAETGLARLRLAACRAYRRNAQGVH